MVVSLGGLEPCNLIGIVGRDCASQKHVLLTKDPGRIIVYHRPFF